VTAIRTDAVPSSIVRGFSLFAGGPLYRVARRLGVVRSESTLPRLGLAIAALTWVPLAVLAGSMALASPTTGRVAVPFLMSLSTHARFLVAIPLFFAAEAWIARRLTHFLWQIIESRMVLPAELADLDGAAASAMRQRDSVIVEGLLVCLTIATVANRVGVDLPGDVYSWRSQAGVLTWAGWWFLAVSLPIFQFLCWRWCWRLVIWTMLLWRVSRLNLQIVPTHPDMAGGLGYLGVAHSHFGTLSLAVSVVLAASLAEQMLFAGRSLQSCLLLIAGIVLLNLLTFLGPLLSFTPRLLEVKRRGLRQYGVMAATYTHLFQAKWVPGHETNAREMLGSADIQSLADLHDSFWVVRNMRLTPFGPALPLSLAAAAVTPMIPLLLFQFSPDQLLMQLAKMMLGW
jgi:hypothetical protein